MKENFYDLLPTEPEWHLNWEKITKFPWMSKLKDSAQDPYNHAEGDVLTHVEMVTKQGIALTDWRALELEEKLVCFLSFLMHDVCKPETQTIIDGKISNPGHSRMGSNEIRQILWRSGLNFSTREKICSIIAVHQVPFHLFQKPEWAINRFIIGSSLEVSNHLLGIQALADARGRICADQQRILDNVEMFKMAAEELDCLNQPFKFHNEHTKMQFLEKPEFRNPKACLWDTSSPCTVTITSGLPGSGKSSWVKQAVQAGGRLEGQKVVCMDSIRREMNVLASENQGKVRQESIARAKKLLAAQESFVWDAINLDWQRRAPLVQLCLDYGARIQMVYVEQTPEIMQVQNREREYAVPPQHIQRMLRKWEPPTLSECHDLLLIVPETNRTLELPGAGFPNARL